MVKTRLSVCSLGLSRTVLQSGVTIITIITSVFLQHLSKTVSSENKC